MGLRGFFPRHRNVFSVSTEEVVAEPGVDDMLVEDYGKRGVEAEREPRIGTRSREAQREP
jgi:hypothetical protein